MDSDLPTAAVLYNYDTDRDAFPGLLIAKGGSGPDESDPMKYQAWLTPAFPEGAVIQGDATVRLWSALKDFNTGLSGVVTVYLRDCDGLSCVELGSDTVATNPQAGSTWKLESVTVPIGTYTIAPGHSLELVVVVDASSDDDMWFAYDTNSHKSRLTVSASASPLAGSGAVLAGLITRWLAQTRARWLFA
jgi:hypothetical protein